MQQPPSPDLSAVIHVLNGLHPLSADLILFLRQKSEFRHVRKGKMLVRSGEICHHIYFIIRGVIRGFIQDEDKEITTWISVDNEVVTSISGFIDQAPSLENIQVIEAAELVVLSHADLEFLYRTYPEFNIVGRKLLERYYQHAEARAYIARIPGTEKKYQHFVRNYPHLINRVPIKYIASFLGVALETISRVRKRLSG